MAGIANETIKRLGIKITEEMIDAGEDAILGEVGGADLGGHFCARELAKKVYLAMARPGEQSAVRSSRSLRERDIETIGRIERHRGTVANKPVIAGTRIPVKSIQAFDRAGYSIDQIREQYPIITVEDIKAALAFSDVA